MTPPTSVPCLNNKDSHVAMAILGGALGFFMSILKRESAGAEIVHGAKGTGWGAKQYRCCDPEAQE